MRNNNILALLGLLVVGVPGLPTAQAAAKRIEGPVTKCHVGAEMSDNGSVSARIGTYFGIDPTLGSCVRDGSDSDFQPFPVNFFGTTYDTVYINQNGSLSFGSGFQGTGTNSLPSINAPLIAPFLADLSLAVPQAIVSWGWFEVTAPAMAFEWSLYDPNNPNPNTVLDLQAIFFDVSKSPGFSSGDFRLELNYNEVVWGNTPDWVGFTNGQGLGYAFPGSNTSGAFNGTSNEFAGAACDEPGTGANALACHTLNSSVTGRYSVTFKNGQPTDVAVVPLPGSLVLLSFGLLTLAGRKQLKASRGIH